ncbi:MAG: LysR family transcriptional regulator [Actinobacteria bacterium]|nr:MAG: LysR family transcriptional regulator [Actinomycetota bacterium]
MKPSQRLAALGVVLPTVAPPVGSYVQAKVHDGLIFVTGQLAFVDGVIPNPGLLGVALDAGEGSAAARDCALNSIAAAAAKVGGVDQVAGVLQITGYLACAEGFTGHSLVLNGASDLFVEVFGEGGRHTRTNIGVASLPLCSPVELQVTFEMIQGEE